MSTDPELERIRQQKIREMINMSQSTSQIPAEVVEINSIDHFNQLVNDFKENIIIVDCWAPWCGPCRAFAPVYEALQKEFQSQGVIFAKLNVDNHQAIAQQFQVTGIPTTLFIHNKKLVHRQVGMLPRPQFKNVINAVQKNISK